MENTSSVCFVGKITDIKSIEGADKIEQCLISNWECVIQKGEFKEGDLVVIAITDAVIPFELAEKLNITKYLKHRKKSGQYTIKTTKLRGVYSTATIVGTAYDFVKVPSEGTDMMEVYGITKYEEPAEIIQTASGKKIRYHKNPNFHIYYKFPNAKNVPEMFDENDDVVVTRKIHGTNARYGIVKKAKLSLWDRVKKLFGNKWVGYEYVYGSHNVEKGSDSQGFYSTDIWKEVGDKWEIKKRLWEYVKCTTAYDIGKGIILYAEIYGEGVQKYYDYGIKGKNIKFFDMEWDGRYIDDQEFRVMMYHLKLNPVEELYRGKYNKELIQSLYTNKFIDEKGKVPEEGVVVKHISGDRNKVAKMVNPAYLEFQSKKEDSTDFH
jgi:RNA ligase (TIGR02306 family)